VTITGLRVRGILDSRAEPTIEAEVTLRDGSCGRGSCPGAIAPGRRERPIGTGARIGLGALPSLAGRMRAALASAAGQQELDERLTRELGVGGVSLTLAISVAYARARAVAAGVPLWRYLADIAGTTPGLPRLLVNVFSGGIHAAGPASGYQQVMIIPQTIGIVSDIDVACRVWAAASAIAGRLFGALPLSASSGILVPLDSEGQLGLLAQAIDETGLAGEVALGVDVAAEHLRAGDSYRFGSRLLTAPELAQVLREQAARYGIGYVEDPFDSTDEGSWRALLASLPSSVQVIGDDLFATDADRVAPDLANGILLKPSQIGTLSGLVAAAARARQAEMVLAVSHRSGETDDTVICDIASALGADLIKVGGPRRGDRLAKYNQLLRLAEEVPYPSHIAQMRKYA
jgi:enolase